MEKPVPVFSTAGLTPEDVKDMAREASVRLTYDQWALVAGFLNGDGVIIRREVIEGKRPAIDLALAAQTEAIAAEMDRQLDGATNVQIMEG